jgi:hypothetical protein
MERSLAIIIALSALSTIQPAVAEPLGSGAFSGASGHATSGSVTVTKLGGQYVIELGGDFVLDGAPDPYVSLGAGNKPVNGGLGAVLASNTGAARYVIDATPATDGATQVIIWCKKYAVPLGVAAIQ